MDIALVIGSLAILLFILFRPRRNPYSRRVTGSLNGQPWYHNLRNKNQQLSVRLARIIFLFAVLFMLPAGVLAQEETAIPLRIRLRTADGSAVVGETVVLERLPEEEAVSPDCLTDTAGQCTWSVAPGLYQVLFSRSIDDISALEVAEGGLRGLGLTVGLTAVTYHFTFHSDTRVYFDAAPDSAVPEPIIPAETHQHGHGAAVTSPVDTAETATSRPNSVAVTATQISARTTGQPWLPLVYIVLGLLLGSGLHFLQRYSSSLRRQAQKAQERPPTIIEGEWQVLEPGEEEAD